MNDETNSRTIRRECEVNESKAHPVTMGNVTYQVHRAFGGGQTVKDLLVDSILFQSDT